MSSNQVMIVCLTLCTLLLALFAFRNSRGESSNLAMFERDGELRASRALPVATLLLALFASAMASLVDHGKGDRTWPLALIGLLGMLCGYLATMSFLRLEPEGVRFGMFGRRRVAYSEIADFVRIYAYQGSPCYVVLKSGQRMELGEGLSCERTLAEQIRQRSGCRIIWHEKGMPHPKGF